MKTIRTLKNKKFVIITILVTVFLMTLISCQKSGEISETDRKSDELSLEEKSSDNAEDANGFGKTEDENFPVRIKPRPPWLPYNDIPVSENTLLYEYEDIYIPFSYNKCYKYSPLTNKWYIFNLDNDEEHEIKEYKVHMAESI